MNTQKDKITLIQFNIIGIIDYLVITIPVALIIILLKLFEPQLVFFIFIMFLLCSPAPSIMGWMIARGSNWKDIEKANGVVGGVFGQLYGLFLGGALGHRYFNQIFTVLFAVLFFILGQIIGMQLGKMIIRKLFKRKIFKEE